MKFTIKHTKNSTSLYRGNLEVCIFVTGSRELNTHYAKMIEQLLNDQITKT